METWIVTAIAVLAAMGASAMGPGAPPSGRLLKVPKVYNALITSDIPLLPSRAETAATAAVGPVLLYSTHLPVVLQPQSPGTTPQHHLDKLQQLQNQLQREDADQQRQAHFQRQLLPERQLSVQQQLFPERQPLPEQQQFFQERPQLPVQQQLYPRGPPLQQQILERQPLQQQILERQPLQQQLLERQPLQQQLPVRQLSVQQQLFPERQQLSASHHQPLQVQQLQVQHLSSEQLSPQLPREQYDAPERYQQKPNPLLQQQYQIDPVQLQQRQLQHQKQLQLQVQQQKQLQLNQFVDQQKAEQDTSYLPMPEMSSYQPPPSVHIDDVKNNKPSNTAIPDVPPPPLPVGKRLQSYSYNSPVLSPPPPTNHHVPYG